MSDLFPVPEGLKQAEYALLIFQLEAREYFDLPPFGLTRLRREFRQATLGLKESGQTRLAGSLEIMLEPPVPNDPLTRRKVQRPSPSFVLRPDPARHGLVEPGDWLELPVLFLGNGITFVEPFAKLLQQVSKQGVLNGQGICELATVEVEDGSGHRTTLWNRGPLDGALTPVVNDLAWWLERQSPGWDHLQLDFLSPTRFLRNGKPLFRARFTEFFPFVLRRVTSMLSAHCLVDPIDDPQMLLDAARQVNELNNRLSWKDWRPLSGSSGGQDLGGLVGTVHLEGSGLADLHWVLQLGSLLQVGKGASYGAGHYQISRRNG